MRRYESDRDPLPLLRRVELFAGAPRFDFSMHARRKAGADGGSVVRRAESWTEWMVCFPLIYCQLFNPTNDSQFVGLNRIFFA